MNSKIDHLITEWMNTYSVPECNLIVKKDADIILSQGYKNNDFYTKQNPSKNTIYGVGSCTKSLTAVAILQLCQNNLLSLDENINNYISLFPDENIKIHDLLCHTSGIPSDGLLTELLNQLTNRRQDTDWLSKVNFDDFIRESFDYYSKDNKFRYYNSGYMLLGKIIEDVSNQSYENYIYENIFSKLDIENFYFISDKKQILNDKNVTEPYINKDNSTQKSKFYFEDIMTPAGGLFISMPELSKYMHFLLNNSSNILNSSFYDKMIHKHNVRKSYIDDEELYYGYGIHTESFLKDILVSHTGSMAVNTAWMGGLLNSKLNVCIACNTAPQRNVRTVGKAIISLCEGYNYKTNINSYIQEKIFQK